MLVHRLIFIRGNSAAYSSFANHSSFVSLVHVKNSRIEQNFTDRREVDAAFELLKQFSSAIINGAIDKHDANRFMDRLIKGRFNTIEESTTVRIPAEELRAWLITLNMWLAKLPAEKLKPHSTVPQELEQMFAESFGVSARSDSFEK